MCVCVHVCACVCVHCTCVYGICVIFQDQLFMVWAFKDAYGAHWHGVLLFC